MARRYARAKAKVSEHVEQTSTQVSKMDFERARRIYLTEITPAVSSVDEHKQNVSTAYKEIDKGCHIVRGAAKQAFRLYEMEDFKREDWIRSFFGMVKAMKIELAPDLVDQAQSIVGASDDKLVPDKAKPDLKLATLGDEDWEG